MYCLKVFKGDIQHINFSALLHDGWFEHDRGNFTMKVKTSDNICAPCAIGVLKLSSTSSMPAN